MEKKIKVKGMHCSSCEFVIKDSLNDISVKARADHKVGEVVIKNFDQNKLKEIYKAIEENGYIVIE